MVNLKEMSGTVVFSGEVSVRWYRDEHGVGI